MPESPCPFVDGYGSGCELTEGHEGNHRFASDELMELRMRVTVLEEQLASWQRAFRARGGTANL